MRKSNLFAIAWAMVIALCWGAAGVVSAAPITRPIAAAWFYMADDQHYSQIPPQWSKVNFKTVDVLFVGPAGLQSDGSFGLYKSAQTGDLATRFKWVIQRARSQNPNIKIIVSQWWGNGAGIWGSALQGLNGAALVKYTTTAAAFIKSYLPISGGIDGYDIDYESNNVDQNVAAITGQIRAQLAALSKANGGRPFYVTVSPAATAYLQSAQPNINFVNMQTYAGGSGLSPSSFTSLGFNVNQLLYGYCPETNCSTPTLAAVEQAYTTNKLAGIHLWRLNSDNYVYEGQQQALVYKFLHP